MNFFKSWNYTVLISETFGDDVGNEYIFLIDVAIDFETAS